MSSFETKRRRQPHLTIREAATEPQVIISRGEDVLDRAQQVAHGIEEHVRQLLANSPPNCSSSNCYAGGDPAESGGNVDNPARRW